MLRDLKGVEGGDEALYLRFTNLPIGKTLSYASGEVNVDLDHHGKVVGIGMLSLDSEEVQVLAEIAREYGLNFDALEHAVRKR